MMKYTLFPLMVLIVLAASCHNRPEGQSEAGPEAVLARMRADTVWIHKLDSMAQIAIGPGAEGQSEAGPEAVLARMRADTVWIHKLDSMAQIAIGPGAKCLDPVSHSFSYEGRTWLFNQDWGGVLEIPADYIIEDDLWQAGFSFHGTRAWSPDSLILVSFYAGFQVTTREESVEAAISGLAEEGFTVLDLDQKEDTLTIRARSAEGINYYGRQIFGNEYGIEYAVSVQYPDENSSEAQPVMEMANRYPAGPGGTIFKGEAI